MNDSAGASVGCTDARVLLMGKLDGELTEPEMRRLEDHLAVCPTCRGELATYEKLGRATDALAEETTVNTDLAWERIYDRLARSAGWALLWIGLTLMVGWWFWELGAVFLADPEVPIVLRVGVGAFAAGAVLLLVNLVRERLYRRRTERYDEVIR